MKKLGFLSIAAVAALAIGLPAATASAVYPPDAATLTLNPSTAATNSAVAAAFGGCTDDETVEFTFNGMTVSATCDDDSDAAVATLTAPGTPGIYPVVGTGIESGATATAFLTVVAPAPAPGPAPSGGLPQTGGDSSRTVQTAASLVAVGAGLTLVGGLRRRKRLTL